MVKLRWLEYFAAVAEELHFGRAAARVHVSTPALSRQVRELEAALGVALFDRTSRSVRLTAAGKTLYAKVQPGLSLLAEGIGEVVELAPPTTPAPTLTVGFVSALAARVIPDALRRFRTAWPRTRVRLEQLASREQLQRLAAGTLDAAFYWQLDDVASPAGLRQRDVAQTPLHVALAADHRLAGERRLELSQLAGEEWLITGDGSDSELRNGFVALCRDHGFTPLMRNEATWIGPLQSLVGASLGVCASPGPAIHTPPHGVVLRPLIGCAIRLVATQPVQRLPRTDRFIADVSASIAALS